MALEMRDFYQTVGTDTLVENYLEACSGNEPLIINIFVCIRP